MIAFFLYILKSGICLLLFYVCFKALFSNDTFFRLNRWLLLTGVLGCFLLPVIPLKMIEVNAVQQPVRHLETLVAGEPNYFVEEGIYINKVSAVDDISSVSIREVSIIPWNKIILLLYLSGCIVCLAGTFVSFYKMYRVISSGRKIIHGNYTLIIIPGPVSPFSWGHYIILSEEDYLNHPDEILAHEKMHLHYRHSLDLIFMEAALILHWFNPAVWLLKRELRDIHEYQADKGVLNQGIDATKYQLLLVKKAVGSSLYTLANSFNHSKIKKRITMMLKKKSNSWARLKLLFLVPVGFTALCVFARPEVREINPPESNSLAPAYKDTDSAGKSKGKFSFIVPQVEKYSPMLGELCPTLKDAVICYSPDPPKGVIFLAGQIRFTFKNGAASWLTLRDGSYDPIENLKMYADKIDTDNLSLVEINIWKKDIDVKEFCERLGKAFGGRLDGRNIKFQLTTEKSDTHFYYILPTQKSKSVENHKAYKGTVKYAVKGANSNVRFTEPVITKDTMTQSKVYKSRIVYTAPINSKSKTNQAKK